MISRTAESTLDVENSPVRLPDSLSSLSHLTNLKLNLYSIIDGQFEWSWLPRLTALKQLCLRFLYGEMRFNLNDQILSLTNLQHLQIDQELQEELPGTVLSLETSWHLLPRLQHVSLSSRFLKFDRRVLGLIKVRTLQSLEFGRCQLLDDMTTCHFGILLFNMAVRRPDVVCRVWKQNAHDVFSEFEKDLHQPMHDVPFY